MKIVKEHGFVGGFFVKQKRKRKSQVKIVKKTEICGVKDKFLLIKKKENERKFSLTSIALCPKYSILSQKYLWVSNHFWYYPGKHVQVGYGYLVLYFF